MKECEQGIVARDRLHHSCCSELEAAKLQVRALRFVLIDIKHHLEARTIRVVEQGDQTSIALLADIEMVLSEKR